MRPNLNASTSPIADERSSKGPNAVLVACRRSRAAGCARAAGSARTSPWCTGRARTPSTCPVTWATPSVPTRSSPDPSSRCALVGHLGAERRRAAGVAVAHVEPHGDRARRARRAGPRSGSARRWPKTPSVWPGTASLVVMASSVASGVVDHGEDVGVLERERPAPGGVERVAERPDRTPVAVGHGADRAEREVAAGDPGRDRGARVAGPARGSRRAGPLGAASTSRSARRAARSSRRRSGRGQPRDGEGRGDRPRAAPQRAGAPRPRRAGSGDSPRICSMGVASATLLPNSPTLSEIAPALRRTPSEPRQ